MNVSCGECRSVFRIDPAKVPDGGVRARCSVCGGVIEIATATAAVAVGEAPARATVARTAPATPPAAPRAVASRRAGAGLTPPAMPAIRLPTAQARPAAPTPAFSRPLVRPAASPLTPPLSTPATPVAPPAVSPPVAPVAEVTPPTAPALPEQPAAPPRPSPLAPTPVVASPAVTPASAPRRVTPAAPRSQTPVAGTPEAPAKRPLNPFLANDPNAKAKRLARALVSDMIAYLPQKRDEGLRDGTLKQLFREEIKKSYEEYVDQIGREFAESTTHFQDALNDLLAGGQKMF